MVPLYPTTKLEWDALQGKHGEEAKLGAERARGTYIAVCFLGCMLLLAVAFGVMGYMAFKMFF